MYAGAVALELEHVAMTGRGRSNHAPPRAPAARGHRRVFWSVEPGCDDALTPRVQGAFDNRTIEITLADGIRVRVGNDVDATALRRVLDALQGR